jgi:sulfopropanediol 3-dehydrogenase
MGSVGCYVPDGKYPLVARAHMSAVEAKVASVKRVIGCAPPIGGKPSAAIVLAIGMAGADKIYCLGDTQAFAAMAIGTKTIAPVDTIVSLSNVFCG